MLYPDEAGLGAPASAQPHTIDALYDRYYPIVFAFARRRTTDDMEAEDVAAQTFLQALGAWGRYEDRGRPIASWLLRIASGVIVDQARRRRREIPLDAALLAATEAISSPDAPPEERAERAERAAWLHGHLAALPADHRRVVWLRYGEDRALDDVARCLGRTPGATKQLLHRTLALLRTRLPVDVDAG